MKKVLLGLGIAVFGFAGLALAHGGMEDMSATADVMMRMDATTTAMMLENRAVDCTTLNSKALIDKGEDMMGDMLGGDQAKHERIETVMEKESPEFHDAMHILMGRSATGCFTDEQQKVIAAKLDAAPKGSSGQGTPLVAGLVIGALLGLVGASFMKKK